MAAEMPTAVVVDDTDADRRLAQTLLEHAGYTVTVCGDGRAGLELIKRETPDLVIADLITPGMDGYEVLAAIRAETLPVRVLLLTARQQESDIIRGFTLGADDYVVKPFSPMELVARLKRLLTA